jgi:seryl-tRNA synthetase
MKKLIFILLVVTVATASCVSRRSVDTLASQRDSLNLVVAGKDSLINDIFFSLNNITSNLASIREREKLLSSSIANDEIHKEPTVQISEDIQAIDELLQQNRANIARLERSAAALKKANIRIGELEKMIRNLNSQVEMRGAEIAALKDTLAQMNIKVEQMTGEMTALNNTVSSLGEENARLEGDARASEDNLNRAYYIVGSQKELLAKELIYKSGFIGRTLRVNENHSLDDFTRIDIRTFDRVMIGRKDITVVTTHPAESYDLALGKDDMVTALVIKDKAAFWQYSKVLVVVYK